MKKSGKENWGPENESVISEILILDPETRPIHIWGLNLSVIFTVHLNQEERWKENGGPENESSSKARYSRFWNKVMPNEVHIRGPNLVPLLDHKRKQSNGLLKVQVPTKSLNLLLGDKI